MKKILACLMIIAFAVAMAPVCTQAAEVNLEPQISEVIPATPENVAVTIVPVVAADTALTGVWIGYQGILTGLHILTLGNSPAPFQSGPQYIGYKQ